MHLLVLAACLFGSSPESKVEPVSYKRDVRPIFAQHCQGCHQPAKAMAGYIMTDYASLLVPGETGEPSIVPGKPEKSYLIAEIRVENGHAEMPKDRDPLSDADIALITRWVAEGAKDDTPATAQGEAISPEKPPVYAAPPVVPSLDFSPDGKLLAVAGYHEVLLFSADGSELVGRLVGLSERVQSVAFSPDGKRLAVAGGNPGQFGEVQVWDVAKRRLRVSIPATFDTLFGLSWSPDSELVAVGGVDNIVRGFNATSGEQVLTMGTHSDWVLATVFSQDGQHLASVSRDMSLKLTEVPTQRFVDNITSITPGALKGGLMTVDRRPLPTRTEAKPDPSTPDAPPRVYDELLVGGADGTPRLYKMHREAARKIGDDANKLKAFDALPGRLTRVRFEATGNRFAAVSSLDGQGEIRVYDVETGQFVKCGDKESALYAVAWHPSGEQIAVAGFDGTIRLYNTKSGARLKAFPASPPPAESSSR